MELFLGSGVIRASGEPGHPFASRPYNTNGVGMSRSQIVAEHLPLLRRYSRALTGSQQSGDAYVAAMLGAVLQQPSLLDETSGARVGLFRLFSKIWNSVTLNERADVVPLHLPPEQRLAHITPESRQ